MTCVSCQREIADGSNFCPYCGGVQPAVQGGPVAGSLPTPPPTPPPAGPAQTPAATPGGAWPGTTPNVPPGTFSNPPPSNRATVALILGIAGVILDLGGCCCFGVPALLGIGLGIAAFVMGRNELEDIAGGYAPAENEGQANAAKIIGIVAIPLGILTFLAAIAMLFLGQLGNLANQ